MNINRSLVKQQAKTIIRGKIMQLFVITFIVMLLTGAFSAGSTAASNAKNYSNTNYNFSDWNNDDADDYNDYDDNDNDDWSNFGGLGGYDDDEESGSNPIEDFTGSITPVTAVSPSGGSIIALSFLAIITVILSVASFICLGLLVTLSGYYVVLIRTNRQITLGQDIAAVFKDTFGKDVFRRIMLTFLRELLVSLLSILLIVPGIVYYYSTYFANELYCDHPNLHPVEAMKLSRKIIKGNRGELFMLDLSFIGWFLLMVCTCGIAGIYVLPYYLTTKALYYENFVQRALAEGRITENDFAGRDDFAYQAQNVNNGFDQAQNNGGYQPNYNSPDSNSYNYTPQNEPPVYQGYGTAYNQYNNPGNTNPQPGGNYCPPNNVQNGAPYTAPQESPQAEQPPVQANDNVTDDSEHGDSDTNTNATQPEE